MTWLTWLGLAVLITAIAALTGIKARGTRPVARTQLMGAARVVLALGVILRLLRLATRRHGRDSAEARAVAAAIAAIRHA